MPKLPSPPLKYLLTLPCHSECIMDAYNISIRQASELVLRVKAVTKEPVHFDWINLLRAWSGFRVLNLAGQVSGL
eukprot:6173184-Pleurochrysis_carterae.AAC.1